MNIFPLFSYTSTSVLYTDSASLVSHVGGRLSSTRTNKSCFGESITFFRIRFSAPVAMSTASPLYASRPRLAPTSPTRFCMARRMHSMTKFTESLICYG